MPEKIRVSLLSLALLFSGQVFQNQVHAQTAKPALTQSTQPEIASGSAMIVDLNSHKVIHTDHPDLVRPIATITKPMTAMVALDAKHPMDEILNLCLIDLNGLLLFCETLSKFEWP